MPEKLEAARALLDPREETFRVESGSGGLRLFLRRMPSVGAVRGSVLYLHGATFPSALSIAYRFAGRSWRDALCDAGFDVWALDFLGFGGSDRYPEMDEPADALVPSARPQRRSSKSRRRPALSLIRTSSHAFP